ncbi:phytanoyl-CoA dioxygenase family protein [Acidihalobacter ferrooxydans]|uniref:Phytanoyl-CoA dioxygenase n=1 Tax=Acidihalobacter ferrooxydans TaxID=1765967 RepID=A0A1P8UIX3_9GAMM|nr:phytanoyl-CoA dioxygenase family protein [Acidihalobacter ferrooxydans]APZ43795.1 hypothetical protein BW247_12445 [Acidihalobacter ferrooxydans]
MLLANEKYMLDAAEESLLPTETDVHFYKRHDYFVSEKIFSDQEIDALLEEAGRYYGGHRDRRIPFIPKGATYWREGDATDLRQNNYITYESLSMRALLLKPLVGAIAAKLAETSESRLFTDVLRYKTPGRDRNTTIGWHIDRHYWQMFTSDVMLTAFIPLHDCYEEHGTIVMVDGSNQWHETSTPDESTALHFAQRGLNDLEQRLAIEAKANNADIKTVPIRLNKGQVCFHNSLTYHGSFPNVSERPRQTISLHFQDKENRYRRYPLPSGNLAAHHTEQLCARLDNGDPDYTDPEYFPVLWTG